MEIRTSTILRLRDALLESGRRNGAITSSAYRTLFEKGLLSDSENEALSAVAPHAESMFLVIAADQQVTDTELVALKGAVRGLTGDVLSDEIVQLMIERYARQLLEDGLDQRLAAIAEAVDEIEALNAFGLAAAVALADGQFVDAENSVIKKMRLAFGLSETQADSIMRQLEKDR